MPQRETLSAVVLLFPVITVEEGRQGFLFIKALQLAGSAIEVKIKLLPVVLHGLAEKYHVSLI